MTARSYVFLGGGTGGHIYPAIAIADEIARLGPAARRVFVCSERSIDAEILSRAAGQGRVDAWHPVPARPLSAHPKKALGLVMNWGRAVRMCRAILRTERDLTGSAPVAVSLGGFVAAPAVQAAKVERCRVVALAIDARIGKASRWIAGRADERYAALGPPMGSRLSWEVVPPIVRADAALGTPRDEARRALGLDADRPVLLVMGGSQGARSINRFVPELAKALRGELGGWQILHQSGTRDLDETRAAYRAVGVDADVRGFLDPVGHAWAAADLAISRAGAGSVAECWATGTPTVFMPYPHHRDEHQRLNAARVVETGGAVIAEDLIEPARNVEAHSALVARLVGDPAGLDAMRRGLDGLGPANGAEVVASRLLG